MQHGSDDHEEGAGAGCRKCEWDDGKAKQSEGAAEQTDPTRDGEQPRGMPADRAAQESRTPREQDVSDNS